MDGEYSVDGVGDFEEDEEEYVGDDKINRQKELVAIVKVNPPLWDKRQKAYSGKNFNKQLAWDSVAEVVGNMSGSEAEKEFYKIRQKYGKERRKVITSLKGKSGQSAQPTYVPTWELYEMCDSFLRAVIIPRKTSSNYTKTASSKSNEISHLPQRQLVVPQIVKPSVQAAQTPSAKWTSEYASLFGDDTTCDSDVIVESPKITFQPPRQQQVQTQPQSQTQPPSTVELNYQGRK